MILKYLSQKEVAMHSAKQSIPLFLFCCLVLVCNRAYAETIPFSLNDLVNIALTNNPQIEIAKQQTFRSEGVVTQAKSVYLPHLSAGLSVAQTHIKDLQPEDEDTVGMGTLSASQLIYDFGKTTGLINSSKYYLDAANANLQQQIQNVIFQVEQAYYSVLEKKQLINVSERAVDSYMQHLDQAKKYYKAGVRTKIDVTNAEVELSNAKLDLLRANSNLKTARVKLEQILGMRPNEGDYSLMSDAKNIEDLAAKKPLMDFQLTELLNNAKQYRPGLKQAKDLVLASEASLTQAKGDYYPSINVTGSYYDYETDLTTLQDQWQIGIGLNWELFAGFETEGKVAEAGSIVREQQASLKNLELAIIQEVTDSYLRADENREGVDLANQTLVLSQENLTLAQARYKAGLNDIIEFNDAQLSYTKSQSTLVVTYYTYLTDLARIKLATGMISNEPGE